MGRVGTIGVSSANLCVTTHPSTSRRTQKEQRMRLCQLKKCPVEEAGQTCQCVECRGYRRANRAVTIPVTHDGKTFCISLKSGEDWNCHEVTHHYDTDHTSLYQTYRFLGNTVIRRTVTMEQYGSEIIQVEVTGRSDWQKIEWVVTDTETRAGTLKFVCDPLTHQESIRCV